MSINTPIFTIAKDLNVDSNRILIACKKLGINAKGATKRLNEEQLKKMNKFFLSHSIYKFTKIDSLSGLISNSFLKKYFLFSSLKSNQLFG